MSDSNGFRVYKSILAAKGLNATEKMVLISIAEHLGTNSTAWPGGERISHEAGCKKRTVKRIIKRLEKRGLLEVIRDERPATAQDTNSYTIVESALDALVVPFSKRRSNDTVTSGVMTGRHQGNDTVTSGVMTRCHQGNDTVTSERPILTSYSTSPQREQGRGVPAEQEKTEAHTLLNEVEAHLVERHNLKMPPRGRDRMISTLETLKNEQGNYPPLIAIASAITSFKVRTEISYTLLLAETFFERFMSRLTDAIRLEKEQQADIERNREEYDTWVKQLSPTQRCLRGLGSEEERRIMAATRIEKEDKRLAAALEAENKLRDAIGLPRVDHLEPDDYSRHLLKFKPAVAAYA